jgi:hypothetical protein
VNAVAEDSREKIDLDSVSPVETLQSPVSETSGSKATSKIFVHRSVTLGNGVSRWERKDVGMEINLDKELSDQAYRSKYTFAEIIVEERIQQFYEKFKDLEKSHSIKTDALTTSGINAVLASLPWAKGKTIGREWIRIQDHENQLPKDFMEQLKTSTYVLVGDHRYRLEGDFIGRYPLTRKQSK